MSQLNFASETCWFIVPIIILRTSAPNFGHVPSLARGGVGGVGGGGGGGWGGLGGGGERTI